MPAPVFGTVHLCPGPGEGPAVLAQGNHGPPDLGQEQLRSKQAPGLSARLHRVLLPVASLRLIFGSALSPQRRTELVAKTHVAFSLEPPLNGTIWLLKGGVGWLCKWGSDKRPLQRVYFGRPRLSTDPASLLVDRSRGLSKAVLSTGGAPRIGSHRRAICHWPIC